MNTNKYSSPWKIRPAVDADAAVCRAWLPGLFASVGYAPEMALAQTAEGVVVGAAGLVWAAGGFPLSVAVDPTCRRRGLGRSLVAAMADLVAGETDSLKSAAAVAEGGEAALFLRALGFEESRRFLCFETDGAVLAQVMARLLSRWREPQPVRLVSLRTTPADQVATLVSTAFSSLPFAVARRLMPGAEDGYDPDLSLAAIKDGRVVGATLCTRSGQAIDVDVNVVAPDQRRGIVNVMLLEGIVRRSLEVGLTRATFACEPHIHDTRNVARRCCAAELPSKLIMVLDLRDGRPRALQPAAS